MTSNYQKLYFWCQWQQRGTDLKLSKLCHRSLLMAPFLQLHSNKKGKTFLFFCFFSFIYQIFSLQLLPINYNYLQLLEITYITFGIIKLLIRKHFYCRLYCRVLETYGGHYVSVQYTARNTKKSKAKCGYECLLIYRSHNDAHNFEMRQL